MVQKAPAHHVLWDIQHLGQMGQRALEDKFDFKAFGPSLDINSNLLICFAVLGMGSVMSSIVFLFEVRKNIF